MTGFIARTRRPTALSCAGLLVVAAGMWLFVARTEDRTAAAADTSLRIPAESLDFGSIWSQPSFSWTLRVVNSSDRPLLVRGIRAGCGCTQIEPRTFELAPHGRGELHLTIDLTDEFEPASDWHQREFAVALDFDSEEEAGSTTTRHVLRGQVRRPFRSVPQVSFFGGEELVEHQTPPAKEISLESQDVIAAVRV
ncbi:MAG: DUF1573 domain-containing protein, partial [Planctomycetota bacterium]|nr:DUF1573 domain-containing protein [Planctomycetota bacterium]